MKVIQKEPVGVPPPKLRELRDRTSWVLKHKADLTEAKQLVSELEAFQLEFPEFAEKAWKLEFPLLRVFPEADPEYRPKPAVPNEEVSDDDVV